MSRVQAWSEARGLLAKSLMNHLIDWVETRDLQIGGGYNGDSEHERYVSIGEDLKV